MKSFLPFLPLIAAGLLLPREGRSQANTALSNLTATSVNADLVPAATNTQSLGSTAKSWKQLYVGNLIWLGGAKFVGYGPALSLQNTGVGNLALLNGTTGYNNTAIGGSALRANTAGYNNVAVGFNSLLKSAAGHNNVAVGAASLYNNTSGVSNSAFGNNALLSNTTGSNNMAIGANALYHNTSGIDNVAIGIRALFSNTTYSDLVAVGDSALFSFNGGNGANTAVGSKAMAAATTGSYNAALGLQAMRNNVSGFFNTAVGVQALNAVTSTNNSTAVGYQAAYSNLTGGTTAVGAFSLFSSVGASGNTAIGQYALYNSTDGGNNTAVGSSSLGSNTHGDGNTGIGVNAMNSTYGSGNTGLGMNAGMNDGGYSNSTALGYGSVVSGSNQVVLGNSGVGAVIAAGSYYLYSDGRFKKDVQESVPGLDFVRALRPVTYHYDAHGLDHFRSGAEKNKNAQSQKASAASEAAMTAKENRLYSGFVAQEVESAAKKLNYEFSGLYKPQNDKDLYAISYADFVVPLVRAVQQVDSAMAKKSTVDSMAHEIDSLHGTIAAMGARLEKLEALLQAGGAAVSLKDASVAQNIPNPVRSSTSIAYQLPRSYGRAKIMITDMSGRVLQNIPVSGTGAGVLMVNTAKLAAGSYPYALYIDGAIAGTKQMLVVR